MRELEGPYVHMQAPWTVSMEDGCVEAPQPNLAASCGIWMDPGPSRAVVLPCSSLAATAAAEKTLRGHRSSGGAASSRCFRTEADSRLDIPEAEDKSRMALHGIALQATALGKSNMASRRVAVAQDVEPDRQWRGSGGAKGLLRAALEQSRERTWRTWLDCLYVSLSVRLCQQEAWKGWLGLACLGLVVVLVAARPRLKGERSAPSIM